jgi:hypothetical protein
MSYFCAYFFASSLHAQSLDFLFFATTICNAVAQIRRNAATRCIVANLPAVVPIVASRDKRVATRSIAVLEIRVAMAFATMAERHRPRHVKDSTRHASRLTIVVATLSAAVLVGAHDKVTVVRAATRLARGVEMMTIAVDLIWFAIATERIVIMYKGKENEISQGMIRHWRKNVRERDDDDKGGAVKRKKATMYS